MRLDGYTDRIRGSLPSFLSDFSTEENDRSPHAYPATALGTPQQRKLQKEIDALKKDIDDGKYTDPQEKQQKSDQLKDLENQLRHLIKRESEQASLLLKARQTSAPREPADVTSSTARSQPQQKKKHHYMWIEPSQRQQGWNRQEQEEHSMG